MDNTLQKLIQLAKADGGKFFVINESGEPILVILSVEEYQKILLRQLGNKLQDVEQAGADLLTAAEQAHLDAQDELKSQIVQSEESFGFVPPSAEELDSTFGFEPARDTGSHPDLDEI